MKGKVFFYLLLVMLFTACKSTPVIQDAKLLSTNHGYIFINFPRNQMEVEVKNILTKKKYILYTDHKGTSGLWLPQGDYSINKIGDYTDIKGFADISIKTGYITNLGSLIYFEIGDGKAVWIPKHLGHENKLLARDELKFRPYLNKNKIKNWLPKNMPQPFHIDVKSRGQGITMAAIDLLINKADQGELKDSLLKRNDVNDFYDIAMKTLPPIQYQIPGVDNIGNLYFGAELGLIKKRNKNGEWQTIQTKIISEIHIVRYLNDGRLLAANKNGELLINYGEGSEWEIVTNFENDNVEDIDILGGKIYVMTSNYENSPYILFGGNNYQLKVFELNSDNFKSKHLLYNMKKDRASLPHGKIINSKYFVGLSPDLLDVIDLKSKKIIKLKLPEKFSNFNVSNEGVITLYAIQGAFSELFISNDNGQIWKELDTPPYTIGSIFFETPQKAIAYRISANLFDVSYIIQKYDYKKDKWFNISNAPDSCKYILHNENYFPNFCVSKSDEIFSYKDNKWTKDTNIH
jgi:hypothetical protein